MKKFLAAALALNLKYPVFNKIDINNLPPGRELSTLISWAYYLIVAVSGLAAFIMLVWGGVQWMSSAGNPSRISDAKDRMEKALLGLLIVVASFLILQIINPDFTNLNQNF